MLSVAVLWPAGWTAPAVRERTVRPDAHACRTLVLLSIAPVQGDWLRRGWQSCRGWMQVRREARAAELVRLKAIHAAAGKGFVTTDAENAAIRLVGGARSDQYGEITPKGFSELGRRLELACGDVFADLGSGTGRSVVQSVIEFDCSRALGIELAASRHAVAVRGLEEDQVEARTRVSFVCGDLAGKELWSSGGALEAVTVVWTCSLLFSDELMARLARRISGSESVRAVATLKRFPSGSLHGFEVERTRALLHEMSWTAAQDWPGVDRCVGDIHDQPTGSPVWVYWRTPLVALERSL